MAGNKALSTNNENVTGRAKASERAPERASYPPAPTRGTSQVEHKPAKARQSEQGDVKEEGIGLLAMPDD